MAVDSKPQYATMIRDMPEGEKPRERLRGLGPGQLSNPELIAILLRVGSRGENVLNLATRSISTFGGLAGLSRASYAEMCGLHGISDAKACQLLAAFELGRRVVSLSPEDRAVIRSPADVHNLLGAELSQETQERLCVLLLNTKAEVLAVRDVYRGTVDESAVRVAEVLRPAVRENCPTIVMVHNHPSGDPTPSPQDILVTRRVKQSAEMMDITLADHVIIGSRGFVSLKEKGLGF
jgi:DNA repair protein RadC